MTTYAAAEEYRQRAVEALRTAGLTEQADNLAALSPIVGPATASVAARALSAAARATLDELAASPVSSATADDTRDAYEAVADAWGAAHAAAREEEADR